MITQLREDVRSVFHRDPAARNAFEVLTCYPGLHALLMHRVNHWLWLRGFKWLARFLSQIARWLTGIEIHPGAKIGRRFFIDHGMGVVIGETAEVGDDVTLYQGVTLGGTSWDSGKRHPTLENGVVVGAGAKILGPFTVGANSKVGSNSVVTKAVPPDSTVVGVPGRVVRRTETAEDRSAAMAAKMGFDAYGTGGAGGELPDPIVKSFKVVLDHIGKMDERVNGMCRSLRKLDAQFNNGELAKLQESDLACIDDEPDGSNRPCCDEDAADGKGETVPARKQTNRVEP